MHTPVTQRTVHMITPPPAPSGTECIGLASGSTQNNYLVTPPTQVRRACANAADFFRAQITQGYCEDGHRKSSVLYYRFGVLDMAFKRCKLPYFLISKRHVVLAAVPYFKTIFLHLRQFILYSFSIRQQQRTRTVYCYALMYLHSHVYGNESHVARRPRADWLMSYDYTF
ncbi:hypothetical protein BaRGS_00023106 [Batillaria attramentaria]|uniref:Uncharacterized protein n=1 Tax=Batillaria attramentaria TaxID=370345 RepID=A0ABD0KF79_9CAEN